MADAKAAPNGKAAKKKGGKLKFYMILLAMMFAAPFMFPTVILLMAGMVPTVVALFVDKDHDHPYATAIGAMNCAGLSPFLIDLWVKGQTMDNAIAILVNPNNWLVILGASAIGQMIISVIPQAMASLMLVHSEIRIKHLKQNLEMLKKSWGPDVGTTKPLDQITSAG